ncbi:MAG: endonuclease/exonuclease/phosphatase [uncultured bacterium]|nr:MAG: endonuclease/exonuclease/phosphatase [uncultured bacterium]HBY02237.1 hypothetical protein [Rikenellaceae bacterium]
MAKRIKVLKKEKKSRSPWPVALLFRLALVISAIALLISYFSLLINPSITTIPLFFGLYFVPILFVNIVLLVLGMIRRSAATWITFFILLPSVLFADRFIRWGEASRGEEGISLKIMTYNVGMFDQKKGSDRIETLEGVARYVSSEDPSVVCFQEFYTSDTANIKTYFPDYPYINHRMFGLKSGNRFGNLILSKYPILNYGRVPFEGGTNLCIYIDIDHYGRTIRIYNTHLESHSISFTSLIKKMRKSERVSDDIIEVHDKVAGTFKKRSRQVDSLAAHLKSSKYPAIICGDFNDTPMSYTYHILSEGRKDTFRESGRGFSSTYSFLWPLLRIDYIFHPEGYWSLSHKNPKVRWSDHYPVISEIIIP